MTTADLVLRDAPVYQEGSWAGDAVAIRDGRILAVGAYEDVADLVGSATEVRSLAGCWLLPGFHDSHVHPVQGGVEMGQCDLTGEDDLGGYERVIRAYAEANPDIAWITGGGWSMDAFERGVPTADVLDRICPDRPVFLPNRDHHSAWVNSRALELAGVTADTPDPADGKIERDATRRPSGALHEGAMGLVARLVPPVTDAELLAGLHRAQNHLHSLGIVGWQDALVGNGLGMPDTLDTYLAAQRAGTLTAKVVLAQWWDRDRGVEQLPELVERRRRAGEAGVRATSVKIMQDGVCETHTAAMLDPYLDGHGKPTDNHGLSFIDASDLARYMTALDAEAFQIHVHALGDRAVRDSLNGLEAVRRAHGRRDSRHHLAHLQVVSPDDVARFAELDVVANAQPLWACRDDSVEVLTLPFMPESARTRQYVFGSLRRAGARMSFGSDWPVSSPNPLWGIHVAVNRTSPDGLVADPLQPEEALGVAVAVEAYTAGSAYVNGADDSGRLAPGYAADLVAVDQDVLGIDPRAIGATTVRHTFVDGREVYSA
ncbi:MAG: amidohydrolase [Nocardioidaceae bacterium]